MKRRWVMSGIGALVFVIVAVVLLVAYQRADQRASERRQTARQDQLGEVERQRNDVVTCERVNVVADKLRRLLVQAQETSQRNPLPPDLTPDQRAYYEANRQKAAELYVQWIAELEPTPCPPAP